MHLHFPLLLTAHESWHISIVICDRNFTLPQHNLSFADRCISMNANLCSQIPFDFEANSRPSENINIATFVLHQKKTGHLSYEIQCLHAWRVDGQEKNRPNDWEWRDGLLHCFFFRCRHDPKRNANQKLCTRMKSMPWRHSYVASRFEYITKKKQ